MLEERGGIAPFGWAIVCDGQRQDEVARSVEELTQWSTLACTRHFPPERGYEISSDSPAGTTPGLLLRVHRGDFRAELTIEHEAESGAARTTSSPVRAYGNARSELLDRAQGRAEQLVRRWRIVGGGLGLSVFFALAWFMIGVNNPVYVLGGMLLVVALLLTLMAGDTLGTRLGEELARRQCEHARQQVQRSPALDHDIRRWKALTRQLWAQRSALTGRRGQPFRTAPRELAS